MTLPPTKLKPWKLLKSKDVSPSKWFPIENRVYELPDGRIVDDFTVTTIADVAMIVPITIDNKVVFVRQFKPGFGDIIIEFPAGRIEDGHADLKETATHELEEETGIHTINLEHFTTIAGFTTKGTEKIYCFLAQGIEFNSKQNLDDNEEIEVLTLTFDEVESMIKSGEIPTAITIAAWEIAKKKFPDIITI